MAFKHGSWWWGPEAVASPRASRSRRLLKALLYLREFAGELVAFSHVAPPFLWGLAGCGEPE